MKDGKGQAEPTVWPGFGLWRGVFDATRPAVAGALDDLAGAGVGADWGARMLSIDSALYGPLSYNNGASWPFLTGFAALALYANGRPDAAWTYLDGTADLTFLESRGYMAELFSGDRLRSIDAAVPHQLFATTGFMSTLMRGLVGLSALPAGTLDGQPVPARLRLAPQLPAGWDRLTIRNLRWQGVTADVSITRNAGGLSVEITPRGGTLPVELHAILPPGSRQLTRDLLWRPVTPGGSTSRGLHLRRFESVAARCGLRAPRDAGRPGCPAARAARTRRRVVAPPGHRRHARRRHLHVARRRAARTQLPGAHARSRHRVCPGRDAGWLRPGPPPAVRRATCFGSTCRRPTRRHPARCSSAATGRR